MKNIVHYWQMIHGILFPFQRDENLLDANRFTEPSMDQMEKLINIKLVLLLRVFHKLKALTILKPSPLLPKWTLSALFFPLLPLSNGKSIRWMLNLPSCMGTCMKKSIWNNLLALYKQTSALYVGLRNPFMVSSKPLELGMPKWIAFF